MKSFAELRDERQAQIDAIYDGVVPTELSSSEQASCRLKATAMNEKYEQLYLAWKKKLAALKVSDLRAQLKEWGFEPPKEVRSKADLVDAYIEHERTK